MPEHKPLTPLQLGEMIAEGYTAPRASMRRVLSMQLDGPTRMMIVGFSIVVNALARAVFIGQGADVSLGAVIQGYVSLALGVVLQYAILGWLVGFAARSFGGVGEQSTGYTIVAWQILVTIPLMVVLVWALSTATQTPSPVAGLVILMAGILSFVLLAAYIAEAYQFRSVMIVVGTMLGMIMVFGFVLSLILPMPTPVA